jgi:acetyltransferase-like isoleucine patch superfamily enzyme
MISIGDYTYFSSPIDFNKHYTAVLYSEQAQVSIGKFCCFADSVVIMGGGEHRTDWVTAYPLDENINKIKREGQAISKGNVIIGNDVWVGSQAYISSGVTIGDGAVIGAHSVVTKDVPPYCIAAGNPARVVRKRFDDEVIERLLQIKWWDWPLIEIKKAIPLLQSNNIWEFIVYAHEFIHSDAVFQKQVPAAERVYDS